MVSENEQSTSTRVYQLAGGVAEGYVLLLKIHKVDEAGQPLQGAVLKLFVIETKLLLED